MKKLSLCSVCTAKRKPVSVLVCWQYVDLDAHMMTFNDLCWAGWTLYQFCFCALGLPSCVPFTFFFPVGNFMTYILFYDSAGLITANFNNPDHSVEYHLALFYLCIMEGQKIKQMCKHTLPVGGNIISFHWPNTSCKFDFSLRVRISCFAWCKLAAVSLLFLFLTVWCWKCWLQAVTPLTLSALVGFGNHTRGSATEKQDMSTAPSSFSPSGKSLEHG